MPVKKKYKLICLLLFINILVVLTGCDNVDLIKRAVGDFKKEVVKETDEKKTDDITKSEGETSNGEVEERKIEVQEQVRNTERRVVAYFPEWAYSNDAYENYMVNDIPWSKVTHINYSFAIVNPETNEIDFNDSNGAIGKRFPGNSKEYSYNGHLNLLNEYKKKYPKVKTLISIGGWSGSVGLYSVIQSEDTRRKFAKSCIDFISKYNFDGIDVNFQFSTIIDSIGNVSGKSTDSLDREKIYSKFVELIKILREELYAEERNESRIYLLTATLPSNEFILRGMGLGEYAQYLDFANIMTYDYHGPWDKYAAPMSPLYGDKRDPAESGRNNPVMNVDWSVNYYKDIIPSDKINIIISLSSRGWEGIQPSENEGRLYGKFNTDDNHSVAAAPTGINNLWGELNKYGNKKPGGINPIWHIKNLLKKGGCIRYFDEVTKSTYIFNEEQNVFLTYEDEQSVIDKINYVLNNNLGGIAFWNIPGDYGVDKRGNYIQGSTLMTLASERLRTPAPIISHKSKVTNNSKKFLVGFKSDYGSSEKGFIYKVAVENTGDKSIAKKLDIEFNISLKVNVLSISKGSVISEDKKETFNHYKLSIPLMDELKINEKIEFELKLNSPIAGELKDIRVNNQFVSKELWFKDN